MPKMQLTLKGVDLLDICYCEFYMLLEYRRHQLRAIVICYHTMRDDVLKREI